MSKLVKVKKINKKAIADLTIDEIQQTADKVEITKDRIRMIKQIENEVLTVEINSYEDGVFRTIGKVNLPEKKSDLEKTVLKMLNEGYKQNDIAFRLGISQALVSKIKRKYK